MAGKVHHDASTKSAPGKPGARSPGGDLHATVRRGGQQPCRLSGRSRKGHRRGFDPIDRRIHRVKTAHQVVASNFASFSLDMLEVLPSAFVLIGLFEVWVPRKLVEKHGSVRILRTAS